MWHWVFVAKGPISSSRPAFLIEHPWTMEELKTAIKRFQRNKNAYESALFGELLHNAPDSVVSQAISMTSCTKAILHVLGEIFAALCSQIQERQLSRRIFVQLLAEDCFINIFLVWYWPALKVKVRWNHTSLKNHIRSEWFRSFLRLEGGMFSTNTPISIISLDLSQALGRADCTAFKMFKWDLRTVGVDSAYSIWETTTWFECNNGYATALDSLVAAWVGGLIEPGQKKMLFSQLRPNSWLVWKPTHGVHITMAGCSFVKKRVIFSGMDTEQHPQKATNSFHVSKHNLCGTKKSRFITSFDISTWFMPVVCFCAGGHRAIHKKDLVQLDVVLQKILRSVVGGDLHWNDPWHYILHVWNVRAVKFYMRQYVLSWWSHRHWRQQWY